MEVQFKQWICDLHFKSYKNNRRAFEITDVLSGERVAICTINLPDLDDEEIAIKDYSENEGMYQMLLDYKIILPAHRYTSSGFIKSIPVCYINWEGGSYD